VAEEEGVGLCLKGEEEGYVLKRVQKTEGWREGLPQCQGVGG